MARRPLNGSPTITQVYGEPSTLYKKGYHTGVDYGVATGTAVVAPANGTIIQVGDGRAASDGRGFFMIIQSDDGVLHNLYHLIRWHISSGRVVEGQHVADSDNTGLSTGAHLHWETRRGTQDFNPADWLYATQPSPTPAPAPPTLPEYARILENKTGVNQRSAPNTSATVIKDWPYDTEPFEFKAYVRGESINDNNIWYVGRYSGGYFWSGAFLDKSTNGLPDQTPSTTPIPVPDPAPLPPTPTPTPDMPVDFPPDDDTVIAVYGSPDVDEYITQVPKFIVIHQWGAPSDNFTRQGVINGFQKDDGLSVHYIVDDSGVYQNVPENKRAQHAGPQGNDGLGIECDPNGGEAMYAHLRLLIANIRVRWGLLAITKHSDYTPTLCPKYIDILRLEPISVPPNLEQENNALLKKILALLEGLITKFTSIFK